MDHRSLTILGNLDAFIDSWERSLRADPGAQTGHRTALKVGRPAEAGGVGNNSVPRNRSSVRPAWDGKNARPSANQLPQELHGGRLLLVRFRRGRRFGVTSHGAFHLVLCDRDDLIATPGLLGRWSFGLAAILDDDAVGSALRP